MTKTYPINQEALEKWKSAMHAYDGPDADCLHLFVDVFATNLRHVSFTEFYDRLKALVEMVKVEMMDKTHVIFSIYPHINKSNTWMTILLWDLIEPYANELNIQLDIDHDGKFNGRGKKALILMLDDGVYSGEQIGALAYRRYAFDQTVRWIFCPFMSVNGKKYLETRRIHVPTDANMVPISDIYDVAIEKNNMMDCKTFLSTSPWQALFQADAAPVSTFKVDAAIVSRPIAIYFDHKMPDYISVTNKLISVAPTPHKLEGKWVWGGGIPLVKGCTWASNFYDPCKPIERYSIELIQHPCPVGHYKLLEYTFRANPILSYAQLEKYLAPPADNMLMF